MNPIADEIAAELDRLEQDAPGPAARIRVLLAHLLDPAPGTVRLPVSEVLLREHILKLGDGCRIVGARIADPPGYTIELDIADPDAPDGAVQMEPIYTREPWDAPEPWTLTAIRWQHADGTSTQQDITGQTDEEDL